VIQAEVAQRVDRLEKASTPSSREEARSRLTDVVSRGKPSPAGLDAYANICSDELLRLVSNDGFENRLDAMLVLSTLDHASSGRTIARGLRSDDAAIRLMSARGLQRMHRKLAADPSACRVVLEELGRAGSRETDGVVLEVLYQALDFPSDVPDFSLGREAATALADTVKGRAEQLGAGKRDEYRDALAIRMAKTIHASAPQIQQRQLRVAFGELINILVGRFFARDTASEYRCTLAELIRDLESQLRAMMKDAGKSAPSGSIAVDCKADLKQQEPAARKATESLIQALP